MLIKQDILQKIRIGDVTLAFRKWKKPAVNKDSVIKTSIGLVSIDDIREIDASKVRNADAIKAGYKDLNGLLKEIDAREGTLYKIKLTYHSEDPRIELRENDDVSKEELAAIKEKLERLDKFSKAGPWTKQVLKAIKDYPSLRAVELAVKVDKEKEWLKVNVRKLKELGLTISLEPGYKLSPRGEVVLKKLK